MKILALAGSLRKDSYNKQLLKEAIKIAEKKGAKVTHIDLHDFPMPFYDGDLEAKEGLPKHAKRLRDLMISHDAIMIASPEYNGSVPAVLKNLIDWASRGENKAPSREAFEGKTFAIMSASPGKMGGSRALTYLRSILQDLKGKVVGPQVTIPMAHEYFPSKKENKELEEEITALMSAL